MHFDSLWSNFKREFRNKKKKRRRPIDKYLGVRVCWLCIFHIGIGNAGE